MENTSDQTVKIEQLPQISTISVGQGQTTIQNSSKEAKTESAPATLTGLGVILPVGLPTPTGQQQQITTTSHQTPSGLPTFSSLIENNDSASCLPKLLKQPSLTPTYQGSQAMLGAQVPQVGASNQQQIAGGIPQPMPCTSISSNNPPVTQMLRSASWSVNGMNMQQAQQLQQYQQAQQLQTAQQQDVATIFLNTVKETFKNNISKYNEFIGVMKEFKDQKISTEMVMNKVQILFKNNPELMESFKTFVPQESQPIMINQQQLQQQLQQQQQQQQLQQQLQQRQFQIIAASLQRQQQQQQQFQQQYQQQTQNQVQAQTIQQQQYQQDFKTTAQFGQVPCYPQYSFTPQRPELDQAREYVKKIKNRFVNSPQKYKTFLSVLHCYQKENKSFSEVYDQVSKLFEGHDDLLREFKDFLPGDEFATPDQQQNSQQAKSKSQQDAERTAAMPPISADTKPRQEPAQKKVMATRRTMNLRKRGANGNVVNSSSDEEPEESEKKERNVKQRRDAKRTAEDEAIINEEQQKATEAFNAVCSTLSNPVADETIKILRLFVDEEINGDEAVTLLDPLLRQNPEFYKHLKESMDLPMTSSLPAAGPLAHEGKESYYRCTLDPGLCSGRGELEQEVLNTTYSCENIAIPDAERFITCKFFNHEEELYAIFSEKYDLEMLSRQNAYAIKCIAEVEGKINTLKDEEKPSYRLTRDEIGGELCLAAVARIYGTQGKSFAEDLLQRPCAAVPTILARLRMVQEEYNQQLKDTEGKLSEIQHEFEVAVGEQRVLMSLKVAERKLKPRCILALQQYGICTDAIERAVELLSHFAATAKQRDIITLLRDFAQSDNTTFCCSRPLLLLTTYFCALTNALHDTSKIPAPSFDLTESLKNVGADATALRALHELHDVAATKRLAAILPPLINAKNTLHDTAQNVLCMTLIDFHRKEAERDIDAKIAKAGKATKDDLLFSVTTKKEGDVTTLEIKKHIINAQ